MFKFSLESLLTYRCFVENILQKELAMWEKVLADEKRKLDIYNKERIRTAMELKKRQKEGINVSENLLYHHFVERLSNDIVEQEKTIAEVEKRVDEKRNDLIESSKKRKMLDKLKEKWLQSYTDNLLKKERKDMDEVAVNDYCRNNFVSK